MKPHSKKALARVFVAALDRHPYDRLVAALAHEIIRLRWTREVEVIARAVEGELLSQRGELAATIVSARALSRDITAALKQWLRQRTGARTVTLTTRADAALVGGAVITTPHEEIDLSVSHKLTRLYA